MLPVAARSTVIDQSPYRLRRHRGGGGQGGLASIDRAEIDEIDVAILEDTARVDRMPETLERFFAEADQGRVPLPVHAHRLPQPPAVLGDLSEKVLHVLASLVLAGLAAFAYPRAPLIVIFLGLAVFGGMIELAQAVPDLGREPSWFDWLADAGAAAFVLLAVGAIRFFPPPAQ